MAIRLNNTLGPISGRVGNKIIRIRYGKEVVCERPAQYNISYSKQAVAARSKFSFTVRLARLLNSNKNLALVWKTAKVNGCNSYQRIIKHNLKSASAAGLTSNNIITPTGAAIYKTSLLWDEDRFTISAFTDSYFNQAPFKLLSLLFITNKKKNDLMLLESNAVILDTTNVLFGTTIFTKEDIQKISNYRNALILSAFLSSSKSKCWTSTIANEICLWDTI